MAQADSLETDFLELVEAVYNALGKETFERVAEVASEVLDCSVAYEGDGLFLVDGESRAFFGVQDGVRRALEESSGENLAATARDVLGQEVVCLGGDIFRIE